MISTELVLRYIIIGYSSWYVQSSVQSMYSDCVSVHSTVCIGISDLLDFYVNILLSE